MRSPDTGSLPRIFPGCIRRWLRPAGRFRGCLQAGQDNSSGSASRHCRVPEHVQRLVAALLQLPAADPSRSGWDRWRQPEPRSGTRGLPSRHTIPSWLSKSLCPRWTQGMSRQRREPFPILGKDMMIRSGAHRCARPQASTKWSPISCHSGVTVTQYPGKVSVVSTPSLVLWTTAVTGGKQT